MITVSVPTFGRRSQTAPTQTIANDEPVESLRELMDGSNDGPVEARAESKRGLFSFLKRKS